MKFSLAATAAFFATFTPALAYPTSVLGYHYSGITSTSVEKRQGTGLYKLVLLIEDLIRDSDNSYDPDAQANGMRQLYFSTTSGVDCVTSVEGQTFEWNVCYLGGEQFFHHDSIGDFSITFTEAGGVNGNTEDGLHTPVIKFANIDDWSPINVNDVKGKETGNLCFETGAAGSERIEWICGIPEVGGQYYSTSNVDPVTATTYTPGWCTLHYIDYQIPSGDSQYYTAIGIYDAAKVLVGQVGNSESVGLDRVGAASPVEVTSLLPAVLIYIRSAPDDSAIQFQYNGDVWYTSDQTRCDTPSDFIDGYRSGNCGFTC